MGSAASPALVFRRNSAGYIRRTDVVPLGERLTR